MTNPLVEAVLKTGLIPVETVKEFKRWNPGLEVPDEIPDEPKSLEEASDLIRGALESQGLVLTRETDINILPQYLHTQKMGVLHIEDEALETTSDFEVVYGKTSMGEYILPYRGDDIRELLVNGRSYLRIDPSLNRIAYFREVREVFFGGAKVFLICTLSLMDIDNPPALTEGSNG